MKNLSSFTVPAMAEPGVGLQTECLRYNRIIEALMIE